MLILIRMNTDPATQFNTWNSLEGEPHALCPGRAPPTWDEWHGIFLPGDDGDVRLHWGGDNALEDRNIASHGFLVLHTDCIGLP